MMAGQRFAPRRHQRGVAAVEFGLLLVPLILMTFGATEFGRAIYTYNTLEKTVRDAARHLSQHGPGNLVIQAEARCLAVYGVTDCANDIVGLAPVAPGLTTAAVILCDAQSCILTHSAQPTGSGAVNLVSASIKDYRYTSLVTYVMPSLKFNNISSTMRAQL
jgi:Flp pilus assembly pilin Flp